MRAANANNGVIAAGIHQPLGLLGYKHLPHFATS